jgi:hypothetical protein
MTTASEPAWLRHGRSLLGTREAAGAANSAAVPVDPLPERWPLVMFWEGAQQDNEIGRSQSVTASFNGIVR